MVFIYQHPAWPQWAWDAEGLAIPLAKVRHVQGRLIGQMEALGFPLQQEAVLETLTQDVLKSSEIEGEILDNAQVRSSVARRLGLEVGGLVPVERHVDGVVEMLLDATCNFQEPLTPQRLFDWHAALFPTGRSGMVRIRVGGWREDLKGPMQVVSGPVGREKVHYQAPDATCLEAEMAQYLDWFNGETIIDPVLKAALAHLWFITLHPFDDGNGRIARAITDMALARSEGTSHRFYSMSSQIRQERGAYYDRLEKTQKGGLDVTSWMEWFLACMGRAMDMAQGTLGKVLFKARAWDALHAIRLNERQRLVLNRLLEDFEGKLTSSKWAKLAHCSQDTAHRDIQDLVKQGVLVKNPGSGRSTSYSLGPFT